MKNLVKNSKQLIGTFIIIIIFIIFKIPHLNLPCFWDEAWAYAPATRMMYNHGLSLLPDAIPVYCSRGHPLLFYFLGAAWMKLFGTSMTVIHSFALFLSIMLLIMIYFFCKEFFSSTIGLISVILISVQNFFLAQSCLLLPEILISFWVLICIYAYLKKYRFLYIICAAGMLLTKESTIILVGSLILWSFIKNIFIKKDTNRIKYFFYELFILIIPILIAATYFIIQKIMYDWFFFPEHLNLISFNSNYFFDTLNSYVSILFIYQGRIVLTSILLLTIILKIFFKLGYRLSEDKKEIFSIFIIFFVCYLIFSSLNFFSPRYILCLLPLFIISTSYFIYDTFKNKRIFQILSLIITITVCFYFCTQKTLTHDHDLGYLNAVKVHKEVVQYCEKEKIYNKKILTHFLMRIDLTNPYSGYLSGQAFNNIVDKMSDDVEFCIFSNMEYIPYFDEIKKNYDLKLIKKFEKNNAWTEIYQNKNK